MDGVVAPSSALCPSSDLLVVNANAETESGAAYG